MPHCSTPYIFTLADMWQPRAKVESRSDSAARSRLALISTICVQVSLHADNISQEGDPKPKSYAQTGSSTTTTDGAATGVGLYAIILVGAGLAFGAFKYLQGQSQKENGI